MVDTVKKYWPNYSSTWLWLTIFQFLRDVKGPQWNYVDWRHSMFGNSVWWHNRSSKTTLHSKRSQDQKRCRCLNSPERSCNIASDYCDLVVKFLAPGWFYMDACANGFSESFLLIWKTRQFELIDDVMMNGDFFQ